jgi:transcription antitermination protein NusB
VGVRREGREHAVQALYALELNPAPARVALGLFWENNRCQASAREFARELVTGYLENKEGIDARISANSSNWSLGRMAKIDLCIIRLAVYELLFRPEIPRNVTINEAIEISKKFGSEESPAFVNGILDEVSRSMAEKS